MLGKDQVSDKSEGGQRHLKLSKKASLFMIDIYFRVSGQALGTISEIPDHMIKKVRVDNV